MVQILQFDLQILGAILWHCFDIQKQGTIVGQCEFYQVGLELIVISDVYGIHVYVLSCVPFMRHIQIPVISPGTQDFELRTKITTLRFILKTT